MTAAAQRAVDAARRGMPIIAPDQDLDFLSRQVLTSRDVRGGVLTDPALGGLNCQIGHHLFPNMPRAPLRAAETAVTSATAWTGDA